jgi:hypothetical protein
MRNKIRAADKRLPTSVRALWFSEERRKRETGSQIEEMNRGALQSDSSALPGDVVADDEYRQHPEDKPWVIGISR